MSCGLAFYYVPLTNFSWQVLMTILMFYAPLSSKMQANGRNGITEREGGAFLVRGVTTDASKVMFNDCVFRNNNAQFGGGAISSQSASFSLHRCLFVQNTALFGGAIFSFRDEERYLRDCDFEGNSAFVAGVMYASRGTLNVRGSTFKHNTASRDNGGALYISGLQYDLQSSQFIGNFADDDGGAICGRGINGNISDCLFEDNIAGFDGGAIDGLTATDVLDSNFTNNTALGCGAMCASVTTLRGCRFEENSAKQGYGGAIRGDFKNVQECYFKGNKASRARFGGGAIDGLIINLQNSLFESNEAGGGGGALRMPRDTRISTYIKGCQFSDNRAVDGGAIDLYDITTVLMEDVEFKGNATTVVGGAINFFSSDRNACCATRTMQLNNCRFEGNNAEFGGAISSYMHPRTFYPSQIHLEGCYFGGNTATSFGGAIDTYNTESIIDQSTFACNSAVAGGAIHNEDDDPYNYIERFGFPPTSISIDDTKFIHNEAEVGGALLFESAPSSLDRCVFDQNEAFISGGAIVISDIENTSPANSTHNLTQNTFQNNKSQGTSSGDILVIDTDGGSTYNCGNGYNNCFCDADIADLPDISTISPADTCPNAGIAGMPPSCTCIPSTPITCPLQSRAGAKARADQDGPHDMEELLKTLHEKQELMFEEMLLQLNSTNASSPAEDDDQESESEELELILEKYGIQIQP